MRYVLAFLAAILFSTEANALLSTRMMQATSGAGTYETESDPVESTYDWYVDATGGNDSNSGASSDQALKTVSALLGKTISAGEAIAFKRGQTHRVPNGGLAIAVNGTSGNEITIRDYGASGLDKPKLYGSVDGTDMTWTNPSGNIYRSESHTYSDDLAKRANQIYHTASPPNTYENAGLTNKGMELAGLWGNSWTQDGGADRWYTSFDNGGSYTITHIIFDAVIGGTEEANASAVDVSGEWYYDSGADRIYVGGATNPNTAYDSVALCELNSDGDWCYSFASTNAYYFLYDGTGAPNTQYSYLELPITKYVIYTAGYDYHEYMNLEVRHGAEGVWVEDGSTYANGTNVDVRMVNRNAIQFDGSNNTWTADSQAYCQHVGTYFVQKPGDNDFERLGHCIHMTGTGDNNTVQNYTLQYAAEDGIQFATSHTGTNNWLRDSYISDNREDAADCKNGNPNFDNVTAYAVGDGAGRNTIVLHNSCDGFYAEDSYFWVDEGTSGNGDLISRGNGLDITLKRTILDARDSGAYAIDCKDDSGDVTTEAVVWLAPDNGNSAMRLVSGHWTSTNDSAHMTGTGGDALFELRGNNTGTNTIINGAFFSQNQRIFDIDNNGGVDMDNSVLFRGNSSNDWINDTGTTINESNIDGGYSSGNFNIDSATKTENPDYDNAGTDDLTISAGSGAASGADTGAQPANDNNGTAYTDDEMGAYSLSS